MRAKRGRRKSASINRILLPAKANERANDKQNVVLPLLGAELVTITVLGG